MKPPIKVCLENSGFQHWTDENLTYRAPKRGLNYTVILTRTAFTSWVENT